jgi:Restriction endonuclease
MIAVNATREGSVGDPRSLLPHEVEIFVVRELRKAGLEPTAVKVRERTRADKSDDYVVQLDCSLRIGDADRDVLIECRNERAPTTDRAVETLHARLPEAKAHHAMLFSTSGFDPQAIRTGRALGIPLLAVADGKSAFARSPWGMAGDPPAWVPEYMAELVDLDVTGQPRRTLLASGGSKRILERFVK